MRQFLRSIGLFVARALGTKIVDIESGRTLGKALVISWGRKVHVIGLETPVRAVFLPQKRLAYWKQEIGFTTQPPPDYPNERSTSSAERDQKKF
jgi:hypothetical protein